MADEITAQALQQDEDLMTLIDLMCADGHLRKDAFVDNPASRPECRVCGRPTWRVDAPSITPNGTRRERNTDRKVEPRVDAKRIAADTIFEIEQKWLRYSDSTIAEQHVSREINEAAGIADDRGNEIPIPKPDPIMFNKPTLAECAK